MFQWIDQGSYDWQVTDPDELSGDVLLGLTIAYGRLDEPIADYGALQLLGAAIKIELGRPAEVGPGDVAVPDAAVDLGSDTTTFAVRGRREAVVSAWRRLAGYFAGTVQVEAIDPHPVDTWGWSRDTALRSGFNSYVVSLLGLPQLAVAPERVDALRRHLDPAQGRVRAAFFTTDEMLTRLDAFAPPHDDPRRRSQPAAGRARGAARPGSLGCDPGPVQLTVVVPRTRLGLAAGLALRTQLGVALDSIGADARTASCTIGEFGADRLITIFCEQTPGSAQRERMISRVVQTPISDGLLAAVITEVEELSLNQWARHRRVLGLGEDHEPLTVSGVRHAVGLALSNAHLAADLLGADNARPLLAGYDDLMPRLAEEPGRKYASWLAPASLSGQPRTTVRLGARTLTLVSEVVSADDIGNTEVVDLEHAAMVIDKGEGDLAIFDDHLRGVDLDTGRIKRGSTLLGELNTRLAQVPRFRLAQPLSVRADAQGPKPARRRVLIIALVALVIFGSVVAGPVIRNLITPDPVVARVNEGDTVRLAGGTSITAVTIESQPAPDAGSAPRTLLVEATVRVCGGDDLGVAGVDPAIQRSIGPANFMVSSRDIIDSERLTPEASPLPAATLSKDQCTEGRLAHRIQDTGSPLLLSYQNAFGDDVVWYDQ